jgi:hypothetical protein
MKLVSRMAAGLCMSSPRFLLEPVQLGDSHGAHCEEFGRNRAQRRTSAGAFDPTVGLVALCGMPTGFVPGFMSTPITDRNNRPRMEAHMVFGTFVLLSAIVFWRTLGALVAYSVHNESGSHIILIPLVSASLLSAIVDVLEQNRRYRNLNPHSEPQLGRRNLYRRVDRRLESGLTRASGC